VQQVVILNKVLIVKFRVIVVVDYVAASLVYKDEYTIVWFDDSLDKGMRQNRALKSQV